MTADDLPCGRRALSVWDDADRGALDDHERDCPHCQAVVAEHAVLADPVRGWRDEPLPVPPMLLEQTMAAVRASLGPHTYLPLPSPHGPVRIERRAAASVLRWIVDGHGGVVARTCQVDPVPAPAGGAGATPAGSAGAAPVVVRLSVSARPDVPLLDLADGVRADLVEGCATLLDLTAAAVHIHVEDLLDPVPADAAGAER